MDQMIINSSPAFIYLIRAIWDEDLRPIVKGEDLDSSQTNREDYITYNNNNNNNNNNEENPTTTNDINNSNNNQGEPLRVEDTELFRAWLSNYYSHYPSTSSSTESNNNNNNNDKDNPVFLLNKNEELWIAWQERRDKLLNKKSRRRREIGNPFIHFYDIIYLPSSIIVIILFIIPISI